MYVAPVQYQTLVAEGGTHRPGGRFIPIEEVSCPFKSTIAEGVVRLCIGSTVLLDDRHWDVIDSLWAEMVEACKVLWQGRSHEFYFPDHPLLFSITLYPSTNGVTVSVGGEASARTCRDEFLRATVSAGTSAFEHLRRLFPKNANAYDYQLKELRVLDAHLRGES